MPNGRPGDHPWTDILVHGSRAYKLDPDVLALIKKMLARDPVGTNRLLDDHIDWTDGENMAEARRLLSERWQAMEAGLWPPVRSGQL